MDILLLKRKGRAYIWQGRIVTIPNDTIPVLRHTVIPVIMQNITIPSMQSIITQSITIRNTSTARGAGIGRCTITRDIEAEAKHRKQSILSRVLSYGRKNVVEKEDAMTEKKIDQFSYELLKEAFLHHTTIDGWNVVATAPGGTLTHPAGESDFRRVIRRQIPGTNKWQDFQIERLPHGGRDASYE